MPHLETLYHLAILAGLLLGLAGVVANLACFDRLRPAAPPPAGDAPLVSILVPARNEALNIGTCAGSLLAQDYPHCELLVLDDHSTDGTGELVRLAAEAGAGTILMGVGGSATNDLGLGALAALGFKFYDGAGTDLGVPTPARWSQIQRIDRSGAKNIPPIFIACDVTNPLLGPRGATTTFGPQKGLRAADIAALEAQAVRLATLLCATCEQPLTLAQTPGAGAAGGIAFGLMVAYGAKLVPGYDLVSDWLNLASRLQAADLILTGEGRFDLTSLQGKGPGSLVSAARRLGKPVHVFAGSLGLPADRELHAITPADLPLAVALPRTAELLASAIARERLDQLSLR